MTDCEFCGSRVEDHDPVFVAEGLDREQAGAFCNYACLSAHIDAEALTDSTSCRWEPDA